MVLVLRRARAARGLLLAATGATLVATVLLTGLAAYGREVVDAGARGVVSSAPADERSVLVQGPAAGIGAKDSAVRSRFADGFAGLDVRVSAAGYAAGRQLTGDLGDARPDSGGAVFASVVFLDGLAGHADLVAGVWPRAGAVPPQAALGEAAATTLHATVGARVRIIDRFTKKVSEIVVAGVWRPREVSDAYWRLAPEAADGVAPQSSRYGPFVVPREDFLAGYPTSASAAWLIEPDLAAVDPTRLGPLRRSIADVTGQLPADIGLGDTGLGSSGLVATRLDQLTDRLGRADLVGRSALITPMLLVVVLGGYALLLVAVLLTEHRRGETALLRARGAARTQLAGLAAREAVLVVLPAAALAPLLATEILRYAAPAATRGAGRPDAVTWLVAALTVAGCAAAMVGPAVRRAGSYVAEQAGRFRPNRWAVAQRAGLDLALVVLAVLGWLQLRQYSSPVSAFGVDPLLAAAPTLGVLAGAVLALRVLPPVTRLGERFVDRKPWTATMLGMWQAGRRPHAGPVLLLALAVGASTLAWCLAGTSERSTVDQADHGVGADLRLVEASVSPPEDRAGQLARLPGAGTALPVWRDRLQLGAQEQPTSMVALDARAAPAVVRLRDDLAGGSPAQLFAGMAAGRVDAPVMELPRGSRLAGEVRTNTTADAIFAETAEETPVRTDAVFAVPGGGFRRVPLGASRNGQPLRYSVALPDDLGPAKLAGYLVDTSGPPGVRLTWELASPDVGEGWEGTDQYGAKTRMTRTGTRLSTAYQPRIENSYLRTNQVRLLVAPALRPKPIPVVATPQALSALRLHAGDRTRLSMAGAEVDVRLERTVGAVPGTTDPAALLVDLPSLATVLLHQNGILGDPQEWWLSTKDSGTAAAAARLAGVEVLDRRAAAEEAGHDPYGVGARAALFAAALGAVLLAAMGVAVDVRATARGRATELAVLHTLGAGSRLLTRALIAEQAFLAGVGVLVGVGVGVGVAATMAPLVILTPAAQRPVPEPLLEIAWGPIGATAAGLLLLALALSGLVARVVRRRLVPEVIQ